MKKPNPSSLGGKLNPRDFIDRGKRSAVRGDYERAIADFSEALRLDADSATAYYNRGNVYYHKGDYDQAIADYEAVLRISPNNAVAKFNLTRARKMRGY